MNFPHRQSASPSPKIMDQGPISDYECDYFQKLQACQHSEYLLPMLLLGSGFVEPGTGTLDPSNTARTVQYYHEERSFQQITSMTICKRDTVV